MKNEIKDYENEQKRLANCSKSSTKMTKNDYEKKLREMHMIYTGAFIVVILITICALAIIVLMSTWSSYEANHNLYVCRQELEMLNATKITIPIKH
jgi:hypothetical protein